jgi:hypothetical protein
MKSNGGNPECAVTTIFLDFDGVLRRITSPKFTLDQDCVTEFTHALLEHPHAKVVISSAWRLAYSLDELRSILPSSLRERIEGVTSEAAEMYAHSRNDEIVEYLRRHNRFDSPWLAIDDQRSHFRPNAPVLEIDPERGFDSEYGAQLRQWLTRIEDSSWR